MSVSEIARIRRQIALEYEAAERVFTGFTATAAHAFITARQENIAACYIELTRYLSPAEAIRLVAEVGDSLES